MTLINFFDRLIVEIQGENSLTEWVNKYYEKLTIDKTPKPIDLVISPLDESPSPDVMKGDPNQYYGRQDNQFIIKKHDNLVSIDDDWSHIKASEKTSPYFLSDLIEFLLRQRMSNEGFALVHASAVQVDDTTYVFPAWRHTGKTNTLISLLQEDNSGYLSDDRVWIRNDGTVLGYPLPINMYPYNYNAFPNLSPSKTSEKIRGVISNKIEEIVRLALSS